MAIRGEVRGCPLRVHIVMSVYALGSGNTWKILIKFMERMTLMLRDGRRRGAKRFYIAGDFNIELGLLCPGNEEDEELCGMYGPHQRWQGYGTDPGGFKRMMWYNIMKEYHCKAMSTRLSCDERKEMAFTHKQWRKNGRRSQQDYILGVEGRL